MLKQLVIATWLLVASSLPVNAAVVTVFGPLPDTNGGGEPLAELSFDFNSTFVVPQLTNASIFIFAEPWLQFDLSLIDPDPNDGNTPSAAFFASASDTTKLFRNGVEIPLIGRIGLGANATSCNIQCSAIDGVDGPIDIWRTSELLEAGDVIRILGTVNGRAGFGISEAPADLDFMRLEVRIGGLDAQFFGEPIPAVPLPPTLWLFVGALGLLATRLRTR